MQASVSDRTLEFYKVCPFNFVSSIAETADFIKGHNLIASNYPDLDSSLRTMELPFSLLDAGCGIGWFSMTAAVHYGAQALGIDFNPKVVAMAQALKAELSAAPINYREFDITKASTLSEQFDFVCSIGVLHHIQDTEQAFKQVATRLKKVPHARLYIGLYHLYGRRPFLKHFEDLAKQGKPEEELYAVFKEMHVPSKDEAYLHSRFRDQVLHPHETQHSLEEVCGWLDDLGMELESTSINRFQAFTQREALYEEERQYEELSYRRNVVEKSYFPGFFTVCARWA